MFHFLNVYLFITLFIIIHLPVLRLIMVTITDLPLLVTSSIFQYTFDHTITSFRWKNSLQLLRICKLWRSLLLPKIYYLGYFDSKDTSSGIVRTTNLDLIASNEFASRIKVLYINLVSFECLPHYMEHYADILLTNKYDLSNVLELSIFVYSSASVPTNVVYGDKAVCLSDAFDILAKSIASNMPNVKDLQVGICQSFAGKADFHKRLLCAYSSQLQMYNGEYVSLPSDFASFNNITTLRLELQTDARYQIPRINHHTIRELRLSNVPLNFKWNHIINRSDVDCAVFSSLEYLKLNFTTKPADDDLIEFFMQDFSTTRAYSFSVGFPKLKSLDIYNDPCWAFLKTSYMFSDNLANIRIHDSVEAINIIKDTNVHAFKTLILWFDNLNMVSASRFYNATNRLLGGSVTYDSSLISINNIGFPINWESTRWSSLTELRFDVCTVSSFTNALSFCPSLKRLYIYSFDIDRYPIELFNSQRRANGLQPTTSLLETICIRCVQSRFCSNDEISEFIKHIIIELKSLKSFVSYESRWLDIRSFIDRNKHIYSHFSNINVY